MHTFCAVTCLRSLPIGHCRVLRSTLLPSYLSLRYVDRVKRAMTDTRALRCHSHDLLKLPPAPAAASTALAQSSQSTASSAGSMYSNLGDEMPYMVSLPTAPRAADEATMKYIAYLETKLDWLTKEVRRKRAQDIHRQHTTRDTRAGDSTAQAHHHTRIQSHRLTPWLASASTEGAARRAARDQGSLPQHSAGKACGPSPPGHEEVSALISIVSHNCI